MTSSPSPRPTPLWVNHIAFRVNTVQELEDTKARLQAHGVEVLGVTDHHIFKSIYFFDPNGIRLEPFAEAEARPFEQRVPGLVMAARFAGQKDHATLLQALALLRQRGLQLLRILRRLHIAALQLLIQCGLILLRHLLVALLRQLLIHNRRWNL